MIADSAKAALNPLALDLASAVQVLQKCVAPSLSERDLRHDVAAGATNADGTLNLVHYAAWLVQQMAEGPGGANGQ